MPDDTAKLEYEAKYLNDKLRAKLAEIPLAQRVRVIGWLLVELDQEREKATA